MIRLIIESPLTNDQVRSSIFDLFDHFLKLLHLVHLQLFVLFNRSDIELVFSFGSRRFKRTSQDCDFRVGNGSGHLRVRHVFVEEDSFDQGRVFEGSSNFASHFDQVERDVFAFEIGDGEYSFDCDLSE